MMKKAFPTFIHHSAEQLAHIFVSAGKVGFQVELSPADLIAVSGAVPADLV